MILHNNDDKVDNDEAGPRMVSIGSLQRRQTAAGLKITKRAKRGQKRKTTAMMMMTMTMIMINEDNQNKFCLK